MSRSEPAGVGRDARTAAGCAGLSRLALLHAFALEQSLRPRCLPAQAWMCQCLDYTTRNRETHGCFHAPERYTRLL